MFSQLNGLQVIKKKGNLPLFTAVSFDLLAGLPRPVSFVSREKKAVKYTMTASKRGSKLYGLEK